MENETSKTPKRPLHDEQHTRRGATAADGRRLLSNARIGALRAGARGDEVDEVTQTTAARLVEKWNAPHVKKARDRGTESWKGYVARSARNSYYDLLRSQRRRRTRELRYANNRTSSKAPQRPGTLRAVDAEPSHVEQLLAHQLVIDLIDEHLAGPQHEVASLLIVHGLSIHQIARRLDRSERTIRQHRQTAINILTRQLRGP